MRGIILAAGKASRYDGKKKYELQVDDETLIQKHVSVLKDNNIYVNVVVSSDDVKYKNSDGIAIVTNDFSRGKNNGISLLLALENIPEDEDIIFMDADIWYDKQILTQFIKSENQSSVLVGRGNENDNEGVKVFYKNQFIKAIGKNISETIEADFLGEAVGIVKLSAKNVQTLKKFLQENDCEWEVALNELLFKDKSFKVKFDTTFSDLWVEIDDEKDFQRAKRINNNTIKLAIFSVDGYDYGKINTYLDVMPFHKKMIDEGFCGELQTGIHSSPQWCQFYSGNNIEEFSKIRGLTDNEHNESYENYVRFRKIGWDVIPPDDFYWNKLGKKDIKNLIIGGYGIQFMPQEYFKDFNGKFAVIRAGECAVKDIYDSYGRHIKLLANRIISSSIYPHWTDLSGLTIKNRIHSTDVEVLEKVLEHYSTLPVLEIFEDSLKAYILMLTELCVSYKPNCINQYIPDMDFIMHFMDFDKNVIRESHRILDEYIQKAYEILQPDNIMIVSDHGMRSYQEIHDYELNVLGKKKKDWFSGSKWSEKYQHHIFPGNRNFWLMLADHYYLNTNMYFGKDVKKGTIDKNKHNFLQNHSNVLQFFGVQHEKIEPMDIFA